MEEWRETIPDSFEGDWEHCLEALQTRASSVENAVQELVNGQDPTNDNLRFIAPQDVQHQVKQLRNEVIEVMEEMSQDSSLVSKLLLSTTT